MSRSIPAPATTASARLAAFVVERFPFAVAAVQEALSGSGGRVLSDPAGRQAFRKELQRRLQTIDIADLPETTPGVSAEDRWNTAVAELLDAVDGFLARDAIVSSLTKDEKLEMMLEIMAPAYEAAPRFERIYRVAEIPRG